MRRRALVFAALLSSAVAFSQTMQPLGSAAGHQPPPPRDGEGRPQAIVPILIYHSIRPYRPTDTADRINYAGMARVAAFSKTVTLALANGATVPAFDPETAKLPMKGDGGPMRIAFGTIPDYADNPKGFRINGVSKGSTAEAIGLQAGDILVQFADKPIKSIYDFMGALGAFKPGDKAVIQWLRGEQVMQAEATLKGRP